MMMTQIRKVFCLALVLLALMAAGAAAEIEVDGVVLPEYSGVIDFGETRVTDLNALCDALDRLPWVRQVNMFANRMTKADCDMLAARFPRIRWGWTLVIAARDHSHLIRTDAQAFSTLHSSRQTPHTSEELEILKYVWDLKALDVSNNAVTDLDFLYAMPDLRVLSAASNGITDITPVASLKKLEYAELYKNRIADLTPLVGLDRLMDLNIGINAVTDVTPLTGMTQLRRLWCYRCSWHETWAEVPAAVAARLASALPDTAVDAVHYPTAGGWRYLDSRQTEPDPHYAVLMRMFGSDIRHPGDGTYIPFDDSRPDEPETVTVVTVEPVPAGPPEPKEREPRVIHTDGSINGG